jgi:hypothetical protein
VFYVKLFRLYVTTVYVKVPIAAHFNMQTNTTIIFTDFSFIVRSNSQKGEI